MPDVPFLVTVRVGAQVWNQWGDRKWDTVSASMPQPMTVSAYRGDKYLITDPRWPDNGKEFTVLQSECSLYDAPPASDPNAPAEINMAAHIVTLEGLGDYQHPAVTLRKVV